MATNKYKNSNRAITAAMMVSIRSSLKVFAKADVKAAQNKKYNGNADENQVIHTTFPAT